MAKKARRSSGLRAEYNAAKREYHRIGEQLYKAGHGGKTAHARKSRRRRGKHKRGR